MKNRKLIYAFIFLLTITAKANQGAVQVPEACAGRVSPCLLKAKDKMFNFTVSDVEFKVLPESIIKVSHNSNQIDVNILKGRVYVSSSGKNDTAIYVNMVLSDASSFMAAGNSEGLQILSLDRFTLAKFKLTDKSVPTRLSENFLSKIEFIEFTKDFFVTIKDYRAFLSDVEHNWTAEFQRQNENQTKALLRSIASEEQKAEERVKRQMQEELERKRVRGEFFYRTFQR